MCRASNVHRSLLFVGITSTVMTLSTLAHSEYRVRVCVGEDQANGCPVTHDAMFGCGTSFDEAAESVCTVTSGGKKSVLPYSIIKQGSHSGGRCGYDWAQVTCRD